MMFLYTKKQRKIMFRYSLLINDLLKALTHKYIRRVPKGVTKTGATRYMYYYAGQEGHGQGIAHDDELIAGASFAFGEHGKSRYHAHIILESGDRITLKYDDGDKKGQTVTMTKKDFRDMLHTEHATGIRQAQSKAEKQLQEAKTGKERGVKFSDKTMNKLEERVKNLQDLTNVKQVSVFDDLNNNSIKTYDDMNKFTDRLQDESIKLDTKQKTIQFLQEYKANIEKMTSILNKVLTQEELNKKFGMVEALTKPKDELLNKVLIDHWRALGRFMPIFEENRKRFSIPFKEGLAETIDDIISNISKEKNEKINENVIDIVKMMLEDRNAFRDPRGAENVFRIKEANKEKIEDFIRKPPPPFLYANLFYDMPFVVYQKNANDVIDLFLSSDKYGAKFNDIPNIKEILKDQIDRGVYLEHRYHIDTEQLKKQIEALKGQSITLDNLPILTESSTLNALFDTPALDKLKIKILGNAPQTQPTNTQSSNENKVQSTEDNKKQINNSIQSLAKMDSKNTTKDTFKNTLSNISKMISTKEDTLHALKQVKKYLPELLAQHKKAYPSRDDLENERSLYNNYLESNGRGFTSKETLRTQLLMAQVLKNIVHNTDFNNDREFMGADDLDNLSFFTHFDLRHKTPDQTLDNVIERVQRQEDIHKSFRFTKSISYLLKSMKR
jgi:hypothetical protein